MVKSSSTAHGAPDEAPAVEPQPAGEVTKGRRAGLSARDERVMPAGVLSPYEQHDRPHDARGPRELGFAPGPSGASDTPAAIDAPLCLAHCIWTESEQPSRGPHSEREDRRREPAAPRRTRDRDPRAHGEARARGEREQGKARPARSEVNRDWRRSAPRALRSPDRTSAHDP